MKLGLKSLLATTALAGVFAPAAVAQDNPFLRGRHIAVTERSQPEFDPEVIRVGTFEVDSSLYAGAEYNDNVFSEGDNQDSDTILRIRPQIDARSNWSVHELRAGASVDHREYSNEDSETTTDYNLYLNGRLDGTRNFYLTGRADAGMTTEARYEPASEGAPEPAQRRYVGVAAGATWRSDRIELQGEVGQREDDYQAFFQQRDREETFFTARASYAVSPDFAVFVEGQQREFDYAEAISDNRDGTQVALRAGVNFELSAPFRGEVSVGQVEEDKDDPAEEDTDGLSLDARIEWFPTQLTTVTFRGNTGISDPGIPQATSAEYSTFNVRVDHELLRNILLFGEAGIGKYEFNAAASDPAFDREDDFQNLGAGLAYKLNKHAHLEFAGRWYSRDTSGLGSDVDQGILSAGLRVFP